MAADCDSFCLAFWLAVIGSFIAGCVILPERLARKRELDRFNVSRSLYIRARTGTAHTHKLNTLSPTMSYLCSTGQQRLPRSLRAVRRARGLESTYGPP